MGALSRDRIASLGFDGILRIMRTDDCSVVGTQEQPVQLRSLEWSADGALLAGVGSTGQVHFWDGAAKEILRLPGERDGVPAVAPAPSGFWVAGPTQILRYVARPHRVGVLSTRAAGIDDLPDGRFAVAENDNLAVWGREGPGWTTAVATNGLVREGDTLWTLNRTGLQGWSFDGEPTEHRPGRSVAAGNASHTRALLADLTTVEPTDRAWLTTLPAPIRRIGPGGEGWLAMVGSGRWLYISPAGETLDLGDALDEAWSAAGRRARIGMDGALTVDGATVPPPAANLAWVSWIGEDRLVLGGPAEEYIVTADGTLQATLRMDDGRVTETRTSGELVAVLSSTRRVEVWDLSALSLAPELVRDTLQADLGVVIRGSKVGLDVP
jgi:WD40 repeat protein